MRNVLSGHFKARRPPYKISLSSRTFEDTSHTGSFDASKEIVLKYFHTLIHSRVDGKSHEQENKDSTHKKSHALFYCCQHSHKGDSKTPRYTNRFVFITGRPGPTTKTPRTNI